MARNGNNAPETFWHITKMACGTVRQLLYVDGQQTAFFVDVAQNHAHRSAGHRPSERAFVPSVDNPTDRGA